MYSKFKKEFLIRLTLRYQIERLEIEYWGKGMYSSNPKIQEIIAKYNWMYYGKQSKILQGDFLRLVFTEEEVLYLELTNLYICYLESGWDSAMREIELFRERERKRRLQGIPHPADEFFLQGEKKQVMVYHS